MSNTICFALSELHYLPRRFTYAADPALRDFAKRTMTDDLMHLESAPGNLYNFHPESHVKQGADTGISYIADMLNEILKPDQTTTVLLETMSVFLFGNSQ